MRGLPSRRTHAGTEQWWCETTVYPTGLPACTPLEFVLLGSICPVREPAVVADSTGMAAHMTPDRAFDAGVARFSSGRHWRGSARSGLRPLWTSPPSLLA